MAEPSNEQAIEPAPLDRHELLSKLEALITSSTLTINPGGKVSRSLVALVDALIGSGGQLPQLQSQSITKSGLAEEQNIPEATDRNPIAEILGRWSTTPDDEKRAWRYLYEKAREVCANDKVPDRATMATQTDVSVDIGPAAINSGPGNPQRAKPGSGNVAVEQGDLVIESGEEGDEDKEEVTGPPSHPQNSKRSLRGRKAVTTNRSLKRKLDSVAVATSSTVTVAPTATGEPVKRKRGRPRKVIK